MHFRRPKYRSGDGRENLSRASLLSAVPHCPSGPFPQLRTRIRVRFLAFGSKKPGSAKGTGPSSSMEPATGIAASVRSLHPLRGFAPCALRWKTHPRFLSFAPVSGFDSWRSAAKSPDPPREPDLHPLWSQRQESNPQPTDYKSVALPLSHAGTLGARAQSLFRIAEV